MPDGLVRTVALLEVEARRVRDRRVGHGRVKTRSPSKLVRHWRRRRVWCEASRAAILARIAVSHLRVARQRRGKARLLQRRCRSRGRHALLLRHTDWARLVHCRHGSHAWL